MPAKKPKQPIKRSSVLHKLKGKNKAPISKKTVSVYAVGINGKFTFVAPKNDTGSTCLEVDNFPSIKNYYPHQVKAVKDRLLRYPGYKTNSPYEQEIMKKLALFMKKAVVPKLNAKNVKKDVYNYIHDNNLYPKITQYAFGATKVKPPGFDNLQKVLHSKEFNNGSPMELVLYRAINALEMASSFDNFSLEDQNGPFFVNRNISTSVNPMVSLNFLNKKDPGVKCCFLIFRIPKGYPLLYMPGLFSTDLVQAEREVFLPSGLYVPEVSGVCMTVDPKKINMTKMMGSKPVTFRVLVLRPYHKFSPFITGPYDVIKMDYFYVAGNEDALAKKVSAFLRLEDFDDPKTFSIKNFKPVGKKLGGSTGAQLVRDNKGKYYVWKRGANKTQARIEFVANHLYRMAGVPVPMQYYNDKDGLLSEFVQGKLLKDLNKGEMVVATKALCKWFIVDAILANWDVLGMDLDNILIPMVDGKLVLTMPIRIDNGGSLTMRAQGKPKAYPEDVKELDTMRKYQKIFKKLSNSDLKAQYDELNMYGSPGGIEGGAKYLERNGYITKSLMKTILARVQYVDNHFGSMDVKQDKLYK